MPPAAAAAKIPSDEDELHRSRLVSDSGSHAGGGAESVSVLAGDMPGSVSKRSSATSGPAKNLEAFNIEGGGGALLIDGADAAGGASSSSSCLPADLDRKLDRHLLPALCCLSVVNYIDRTNLAFAASGLKRDVGITLSQYGMGFSFFRFLLLFFAVLVVVFPSSLSLLLSLSLSPPTSSPNPLSKRHNGLGSALLFVTYGAAQLPIAALSSRVGLVRTLGCACFLWGVVAASFAAVNSVGSFYACRLALGLAEAPTFPLIITILRSFHASDGAVRMNAF